MKKEFENAILLGTEIVENGGEIARAEETVERICKSFGAENINVFIIPSLISVTATINEEEITSTRRIYKNDLNLGALEKINSESRKKCNEKTSNSKINYHYNIVFSIFCVILATGAFCIFFGGTLLDALFSGLAGIIINYMPYSKKSFNIFSKTLIEATIAGMLSFIPSLIGISTHPDKIMIGTIMLLIPGMSIGASMKDMMSGNLIAGILQLIEAIIIAFAIALGFSISLIIFGSDYLA
ncbi:MAG: threonine/serine exporter family protein, partial [Eubacterium sp.]|nr:threonine/serine exporter family protein [Eubacterium sp.]